MHSPLPERERLPYVKAVKARGKLYLYYHRDGKSEPLTGPEFSEAFLSDYDVAHGKFEQAPPPWNAHTLGTAIADYLGSADYLSLKPKTKSSYKRELDRVSAASGAVYIEHIDTAWVEHLRDRYVGRGDQWNSLRSRMVSVFDRYRKLHPKRMPHNLWRDVKRLPTKRSDQNRLWPDDVLLPVLRAATVEFRALLVTLLMTSQRIGDVVAFTPEQYDYNAQTLTFAQGKTKKPMVLHVPKPLGAVFASMAARGRRLGRLLLTPRGRRWTEKNAEETLRVLLRSVGLGRYTLHGLRATGPSALKSKGFENRAIRALTGHESDQTLEVYLRGVATYPMAKVAQKHLATRFGKVVEEAQASGNTRKFAGLTGRAASKAARQLAITSAAPAQITASEIGKRVENGKRSKPDRP